jgi:MscS family membrane protein
LSEKPEGNLHDVAGADRELVDSISVDDSSVDIELQRVELQPGQTGWLFSTDTLTEIPRLHSLAHENGFEKQLPAVLVETRFFDTSLWQWLALVLLVPALGAIGRLVSHALLFLAGRFVPRWRKTLEGMGIRELVGPVGLLLGVAAYGAGLSLVAPSALVRFYISRLLTLLAFMAIAWIVMRLLEILSRRMLSVADVRQRALYSSMLPLALRVTKIFVFVIALLATMSTWGYNTGTIWATLGVGSLAVALAAQKTLENFFGGVSVIGDRPVLVGDFCKVGDMMGIVEEIGLRSTRIRTLARTMVTVPNSQFSTMTIENFTRRDKIFFNPKLTIRCDATSAQMNKLMESFESLLRNYPEVEVGRVPIRFNAIGDYSFNVEIFAYIKTRDVDHFFEVQSKLYIKLIELVEAAGTGLAVPVTEILGYPKAEGAGDLTEQSQPGA